MYDIRDDMKPEDVPVPEGARRGPVRKYPFELLLVGQHFVVPGGEAPEKTLGAIRSAAWRFRKQHPERRYDVRLDIEANVVRAFRVEDSRD